MQTNSGDKFKRFGMMAAAAALVGSGLAPAPAHAVVYDAFASFNGTQGAGNFFYGSVLNGVFTLGSACGPIDFPLSSCLGSASYPYFGVAASAGPHLGATLPTDRLLTHTSNTRFGLMAWRAPTAGTYQIDGVASLHHQNANLGNGIGVTGYFQEAGQPIQLAPRIAVTAAGQQTFSLTRSFAANDIYGFIIDPSGFNAYDLSGINVVVTSIAAPGVPEPASWAMLIAGFGLTGAVARRRRVMQRVTA